MDCIESIFLVSATIACVITVFSATVIVGVKAQTPLANLFCQDPKDRPRHQNYISRGEATFFTGAITVVLAMVTLVTEFAKLEEGGHIVTMWIFNKTIAKGCAEVLVALGMLRLMLAAWRGLR
jgi:hypothetical protein